MSETTDFIAAIEQHTGRPGRRNGKNTRLLCPAHDDDHPSLDVAEGDNRKPVAVCRSHGCSYESICEAIGWQTSSSDWEPEAVYVYTDEQGKPLREVGRFPGKRFLQRRAGAPDWRGGVRGVRSVLYRLPEVITAAAAGETVYVAEGEKDVHALERAGVAATCNPMGAGKWREKYAETLRVADVIIVQDKDDAGRKHATQVAASLEGIAKSVRIVEAAEGNDAADHLAAGYDVSQFNAATADEQPPVPAVPSRPLAELLHDVRAFVTRYIAVGPYEAVAITLWIAHAWVLDAFEATGYLEIRSPGPTLRQDDAAQRSRPVRSQTMDDSRAERSGLLQEDRRGSADDPARRGRCDLQEEVGGDRRTTRLPERREPARHDRARCAPPRMDIVGFAVFCARRSPGSAGCRRRSPTGRFRSRCAASSRATGSSGSARARRAS